MKIKYDNLGIFAAWLAIVLIVVPFSQHLLIDKAPYWAKFILSGVLVSFGALLLTILLYLVLKVFTDVFDK
jgi:hypothetical protein